MENQGFSTQLLEVRGAHDKASNEDALPEASPLFAKAKGLAGPSPDNPRHPNPTYILKRYIFGTN
jgi:hypothetical protein